LGIGIAGLGLAQQPIDALRAISVDHKTVCKKKAPGGPEYVPPVTELLPPSPHSPTHDIVRKAYMAWFVLFLAGICEVSWAVGLKYTDGFSRIWPTAGTLAAMALSVALLGLTLRWLPLGTAYAVWTGVGMVGTALLGIVLFEEPADLVRMLCISVIMAGIVGLKLVSPH
jgi:quaternary ammonium compound-resistance protein SugE